MAKTEKTVRFRSEQGYTLIELVLVLVIVGILAASGMKSLQAVHQTSRVEETRDELDRLAVAMAGDPSLVSGGIRSDFGYVGDVGALPPNLDALVSNPGGYATWDGPYIGDEFSLGGAASTFKVDAWGTAYSYSGEPTISSTGGPTTLTRELAKSVDDLLYNDVAAVVTDLDHTPPGTTYRDSVRVLLSYPNGSGGTTTESRYPRPDGLATFDSIPVGRHLLRVVYIPSADTLTSRVIVNPGDNACLEISMAENLWSGS